MAENIRDVMSNVELSPTARLAYWWIRATSRNGYSYESNTAIGERLGVSHERVSQISRELVAANLIRREAGGRGSGACKRWAILGLAVALFSAGPPAESAPLDLFGTQAQSLHFAATKKRRRRSVSAEQTSAA